MSICITQGRVCASVKISKPSGNLHEDLTPHIGEHRQGKRRIRSFFAAPRITLARRQSRTQTLERCSIEPSLPE